MIEKLSHFQKLKEISKFDRKNFIILIYMLKKYLNFLNQTLAIFELGGKEKDIFKVGK